MPKFGVLVEQNTHHLLTFVVEADTQDTAEMLVEEAMELNDYDHCALAQYFDGVWDVKDMPMRLYHVHEVSGAWQGERKTR